MTSSSRSSSARAALRRDPRSTQTFELWRDHASRVGRLNQWRERGAELLTWLRYSGDLASLLAEWGTGYNPSDLNWDGVVDASDLAELLAFWGRDFPG